MKINCCPIFRFFSIVSFFICIPFIFPTIIYAEITSCGGVLSPSSLQTSSTSTLTLTLENTDTQDQDIVWINIESPNGITLNSAEASGWSPSINDNTLVLEGGALSSGSTLSVSMSVTTGSTEVSSASWTVSATDDGSGLNLVNCDGSLSSSSTVSSSTTTTVTVTNTVTNTVTAKDTTNPTIRIDSVSSQTSRLIPTLSGVAQDNGGVESIEYSRDGGSTWTSVSITKANTVSFSFVPIGTRDGRNTLQVRAKDKAGNSTTDSVSFTLDRTGPTLSMDTKLERSYVKAPLLKGTAKDISGVTSVEYTLDGNTWYAVSSLTSSQTQSTFSVELGTLDDGEYAFNVRGLDAVGNTSELKPQTITIDRLPPRIGAMVVSIGTQILSPSIASEVLTIPAAEHTFTVSVIGGPRTVQVHLRQKDQAGERTIPLLKKNESNLWSGSFSFENPGIYTLEVEAEDANATTKKTAIPVHVVPAGKVDNRDGVVSLYTQDITGDYVLWDGSPYGQNNPVRLDESGNFSFLPPAGMYYLEIKPGVGYRNIITNAFTLPGQLPVTPQISPKNAFHINIGSYVFSLPSIGYDTLTIAPYTVAESIQNVEHTFPKIKLPSGDEVISPTYLEGKWSIVTILNTWMPQTPATISTLTQLSKQYPNVRFIVIIPHESSSSVDLYKKRGEYPLTFAADPDGILLESLPYPYSPTVYLFNELAISQYSLLGLTQDVQRLLSRSQ